jgi:hypothetical protein
LSFREIEPRASRLWIRFSPRRWPAADRPYLDLAERRIVWPAASGRAATVELPSTVPPGEVVLLPPVEKDRTREKQAFAVSIASAGGQVLNQEISTAESGVEGAGVTRVIDLLFPVLERDLAVLDVVSPKEIVLVPLLPVVNADEAAWEVLLRRLAPRTPRAVVGVAPELAPPDRRRLVERLGEESFERVHHAGSSPVELERGFARAVVAAGLNPFFDRLETGLPPRAARNRRIAAVLFEAGERWLALGRGEADGASLLAAGRHVESAAQEIEALARERQLALLPFLSPLARATVERFVAEGRSALLAELRAEWTGAGVAA